MLAGMTVDVAAMRIPLNCAGLASISLSVRRCASARANRSRGAVRSGLCLGVLWVGLADAAMPPGLEESERSPLSAFFIAPVRVVWQSETGVERAEALLQPHAGQALLQEPRPPCRLTAGAEAPAGVLLDFGRELTGYVELITTMMPEQAKLRRVRVRFGESVSEAMAELGGPQNAQNDHALRDQVVALPWLGKKMVGPGGFRFVRIDNVDPELPLDLSQVRAVLQLRDIPYLGSFRCDDERLNQIWQVGAYTVHLNMQEYLWDGIKRDRLVWIGDMHPEVSTIHAVFGFNDVVPASLDLTRDVTPVTEWMNGISSYSMWWVLIHEDLWMHLGDRSYLEAQQPYLTALLRRLAGLIGPDGRERIDGMRFLDWPSSANPQGVTAGLQALLVMTLESGVRLMTTLGDTDTARVCADAADRGRRVVPDPNGSKSGAALLSLAGLRDARQTSNTVLKPGGVRDVSTFYGFYVLQALAKAGEITTAMEFIRTYWGAMLDLGATTFWEDFNLEWTNNAARIDELVPPGRKDIHGDFGAYCYEGFRHSLCHGWASGPTAWLSQHVLGVTPLEPGFARARVAPELGDLNWAEGSYPTPRGPIQVRHERQPDGTVLSRISAPPGVEIERGAGASTYRNPILPGNLADPAVIRHEGVFYLYATGEVSGDNGTRVFTSKNLVDWERGPVVFQPGEPHVWAPDVWRDPDTGRFYLYYTVNQTVGVADAEGPLGPFTVHRKFVDRAIDAHLFRDDDGQLFLYYVQLPGFRITVQRMASPTQPVGEPKVVLQPESDWEKRAGQVTEGPWMIKHAGRYYMLYSGSGADTPDYAVGYATADSPMGPFTRAPHNPIIHRSDGLFGPGHGCALQDDAGQWWHVYHQKRHDRVEWDRFIALDPLWFDDAGNLHGRAARGQYFPAPVIAAPRQARH
jgi:alpha-L-rhamnosidase